MRQVLLYLLAMWEFALCSQRNLTMSSLPSKQAARSWVELVRVTWFTSAPAATRSVTILKYPAPAAHQRAVAPSITCPSNLTTPSVSLSAWYSVRRHFTTSSCPFLAAAMSGEQAAGPVGSPSSYLWLRSLARSSPPTLAPRDSRSRRSSPSNPSLAARYTSQPCGLEAGPSPRAPRPATSCSTGPPGSPGPPISSISPHNLGLSLKE